MPVVFIEATGTPTTTSPDVLDTDTKVWRYLIGGGHAVTQTDVVGVLQGRDRHEDVITSYSSASGTVTIYRDRGIQGTSTPASVTSIGNIVYVPSVAPPIGSLSIAETPLGGMRLAKGRSHYIDFVVTGRKLLHLEARLRMTDVNRNVVLEKKYCFDPGGAIENQSLVSPQGLADRDRLRWRTFRYCRVDCRFSRPIHVEHSSA